MSNTAYATEPSELIHVGTRIEPWETSISRERQLAYGVASDLGPEVFGDTVDASILANDTILATRYLKTGAQDGLHAGQRLVQHQPIEFDEPLSVNGTVVDERKISKGTLTTTRFEVVRPDGSVPIVTDIISLRIDYAAMKAKGGGGQTGLSSDGYDLLAKKPLSPEKVGAYSFEFPDYKVHFEPEVAAAMGLRAPIAQGAMTLSWIAGEIAKKGNIETLDVTVSFRQPIFWDQEVAILGDDAGRFLVTNSTGAVCSTGNLAAVTYRS
jgi:hypothetical protein